MSNRKGLGWFLVSLSTISILVIFGVNFGYDEIIKFITIFIVEVLIIASSSYGLYLILEKD